MKALLFVAVMILISAPAMAQGKLLQLELAEDRVDITTGFNGTKVILFGTSQDADANLIITLKGPEHTIVVRQKKRVLGAWMNRDDVEFRRVPSYYDYATTFTASELSDHTDFIKANHIGVDHLDFYSEDESNDEMEATFRDALIRQMQEKGFYALKSHPLQFIDANLFKASFDLPPGVPTGIYQVEAMLVKGQDIVARETRKLQVGQVGFNAQVYIFAQDHSFFYGVFAVILAIASGWSAFTFLRRD